MRIVIFCHSIVSDWNHGNAHFLRGVATELIERGHDVHVLEPADGWSRQNLVAEHGETPLERFRQTFPRLTSEPYMPQALDLDRVLVGADLVVVHEWNDHDLVRRIGDHHARHGNYQLLFHDTHHRAVTDPAAMARYDLRNYDGVLAFGKVIRDLYLEKGWTSRAWTWHEAADTRVFHPHARGGKEGDLVWIGNWGDDERTRELQEFLFTPVKRLGLRARIHGVRYPDHVREALERDGIRYAGWVANYEVPRVFSSFRATVHVPRRPYVEALPGIPTIRVFEALACGIPLVSAPWNDTEGLFNPGRDFLVARDGEEMVYHLRRILSEPGFAARLAEHGRRTVLSRHTCAHRVDELLRVTRSLRGGARAIRTTASNARGGLDIAFFGSSLVSSYWNGAATYYRGIIRALHARGHRVTFFEPDAYERQQNRDMDDPEWARVVVYPGRGEEGVRRALESARGADVVVKASGVGVFDELLDAEVLKLQGPDTRVVYWDVDAPATLDRVNANPNDAFRPLIPRYDMVLTYGGGDPVVKAYEALAARRCVPIYNALDPDTHHPVPADARFEADLAFLGNRLPDREARVEEFFLKPAVRLADKRFLLGGAGWDDKARSANVRYLGHVGTRDHNAFNCSPLAVLNVSRESMARYGFSPATRVFEAAGAGACLITDHWEGIERFLTPGEEVLVARTGDEVADILASLTPERARDIGRRALARVLREHTYAHRAAQVEALLLDGRKGVGV